MNGIFLIFCGLGLMLFMLPGDPSAAISAMLDGTKQAVTLSVQLCAVYAVWLSVLKVMSECKIDKYMSAFFAPVCKKLFPGESNDALDDIALNFSANLLGMGGAATPLGIRAIEKMTRGDIATDNMILFAVINTTSIQLIPATVIALRASYGSAAPSDIILPSLISTAVTTLVGVTLCFIIRKIPTNKLKAAFKRKNRFSRIKEGTL